MTSRLFSLDISTQYYFIAHMFVEFQAPAKRFFMSHLDRNGDGDLTAAEYAASFCRMNLCRKDARGQLIAVQKLFLR